MTSAEAHAAYKIGETYDIRYNGVMRKCKVEEFQEQHNQLLVLQLAPSDDGEPKYKSFKFDKIGQ